MYEEYIAAAMSLLMRAGAARCRERPGNRSVAPSEMEELVENDSKKESEPTEGSGWVMVVVVVVVLVLCLCAKMSEAQAITKRASSRSARASFRACKSHMHAARPRTQHVSLTQLA